VSNARSHRRRISAAKTRALIAEATTDAPALVMFGSGQGDGTHHQPIVLGQVLYVVMLPPAGASDALLWAYSARATAAVTGRCPACGARRHIHQRAHTGNITFHHEHDCPAGDDNLIAQVRAERAA
jgi:hypothetical protein